MQSDKKYKIVEFFQTEKENLSEDQKIDIFKVMNKFYSEIQLLEKKYLLEL